MTLSEIRRQAIMPALALLPARMSERLPQVEVLLLAIGLQESRFTSRRQLGGGPARSYWQGEITGGMILVLDHAVTKLAARALCAARGVPATPRAVYTAIEHDDILAAGLARLLLWSDPFSLPRLGDAAGAWDLYIRTWRPGKPHRHTWDALYAQALAQVRG